MSEYSIVDMEVSCVMPSFQIYWFKDGQEIPPDSQKYLMQSAPDGTCYLHIPGATLHEEGQYTVMAVSPAGKVRDVVGTLSDMLDL